MTKATREQFETLAALGLFKGRDMTTEKAQTLIDEARASGVKENDDNVDEAYLKILQLLKRRATAELKDAEANKAKKKDIIALRLRLVDLGEEISQLKSEERETKTYYEDPAKYKANRIHEEIQGYRGCNKLTKKPTKAEVKAVVEALIEQKPDWETYKDGKLQKLIIDTLRRNYKHLRSKSPRPNSGKSKKQKSTGCFTWLFLIILCIIVYYMIF